MVQMGSCIIVLWFARHNAQFRSRAVVIRTRALTWHIKLFDTVA